MENTHLNSGVSFGNLYAIIFDIVIRNKSFASVLFFLVDHGVFTFSFIDETRIFRERQICGDV